MPNLESGQKNFLCGSALFISISIVSFSVFGCGVSEQIIALIRTPTPTSTATPTPTPTSIPTSTPTSTPTQTPTPNFASASIQQADLPPGFEALSAPDREHYRTSDLEGIFAEKFYNAKVVFSAYYIRVPLEIIIVQIFYPLSPAEKVTFDSIFSNSPISKSPGYKILPGADNFGDFSTAISDSQGLFTIDGAQIRRGAVGALIFISNNNGRKASADIVDLARILNSRMAAQGLK